ncbi:hypothetical protein LNQ03_03430 [Klebsiella pneumoniae subsp. pneumoniae]|nr:hypothetical protein [Klebsiella pneumoniae subsp. pneumoniae]
MPWLGAGRRFPRRIRSPEVSGLAARGVVHGSDAPAAPAGNATRHGRPLRCLCRAPAVAGRFRWGPGLLIFSRIRRRRARVNTEHRRGGGNRVTAKGPRDNLTEFQRRQYRLRVPMMRICGRPMQRCYRWRSSTTR